MKALDVIHLVPEVEKRLADEMSHKLYDIRLDYFLHRNMDFLQEEILNLDVEFNLPELDYMYKINEKVDDIIIFGAGKYGKYTLRLLRKSKYKNEKILFCDNAFAMMKEGVEGIPVISPQELVTNHQNSIVILSSPSNRISMYNQIIIISYSIKHADEYAYKRERILLPIGSFLYGEIGWQYFDYFEPDDSEIFLDGGCFNGLTTKEFTEWTRGGGGSQ